MTTANSRKSSVNRQDEMAFPGHLKIVGNENNFSVEKIENK